MSDGRNLWLAYWAAFRDGNVPPFVCLREAQRAALSIQEARLRIAGVTGAEFLRIVRSRYGPDDFKRMIGVPFPTVEYLSSIKTFRAFEEEIRCRAEANEATRRAKKRLRED